MSSTDLQMKGWIACGVGSLLIAIAVVLISDRKETSAATVRTSSVAASPRNTPPSPSSTTSAERKLPPESHRKHREDFAAAMSAALKSADELNDDRDVFELGYRWIAVEPEAALEFVLHLPFDNTLLLVALVDEWTRRDPASAAAWASRLPEGSRRDRVLPSLVAVWAENAPTDALRFASDLPPGKAQNEAVVAAVSGWARQDPPAALAWTRQFLHGEQQEKTFTQVVYAWGQQDPVSAGEWLRAMPDGPVWDSAVSTLSGVLVERYPALALSLAGNISDHEIRNQRIENVARRWLAYDRAAAEHALIHSDLPAALVSRLLR